MEDFRKFTLFWSRSEKDAGLDKLASLLFVYLLCFVAVFVHAGKYFQGKLNDFSRDFWIKFNWIGYFNWNVEKRVCERIFISFASLIFLLNQFLGNHCLIERAKNSIWGTKIEISWNRLILFGGNLNCTLRKRELTINRN